MAKKKPGIYAHVIHNLPRTFGAEEPGQQEKIDAVKEAIIAEYKEENGGRLPPASHLAREWADLRVAKDDLEKQLSDVQVQLDAYTQLAVDQYDAEGVEKIYLDTGEAPRVQYEPYFSVEDPDKFREWLMKNGYERKLTLQWQVRSAIGKEVLLAGEDLPPGLKAWNKPKLVKR